MHINPTINNIKQEGDEVAAAKILQFMYSKFTGHSIYDQIMSFFKFDMFPYDSKNSS